MVQGVTWLDSSRILIENSNGSYRIGLWSADVADLANWTPVTREFRWVLNATLTADRLTAVATQGEKRSGIWVSGPSGADPRILVPENASAAGQPFIDASGSVTYSAETTDGLWAIYRLAAGAQRPTVIANEVSPLGYFAVTDDGRFVVFARSTQPGLFRINSDGSGLTKLMEQYGCGPAVTRDGRTVLYSSHGPGLFSIPVQGGTPRRLIDRVVNSIPDISPDGRRLLVATDKFRTMLVCDLPDCINVTEVQLRKGGTATARWSPDGRGIAYIDSSDHRNLWVQPLDGGPSYALTHYEDARIREFAWSPDGTHLVSSRGHFVNDVVLISGLR
jgi:Tol biopolymer transport system component